jgi:hypothetical protein
MKSSLRAREPSEGVALSDRTAFAVASPPSNVAATWRARREEGEEEEEESEESVDEEKAFAPLCFREADSARDAAREAEPATEP